MSSKSEILAAVIVVRDAIKARPEASIVGSVARHTDEALDRLVATVEAE